MTFPGLCTMSSTPGSLSGARSWMARRQYTRKDSRRSGVLVSAGTFEPLGGLIDYLLLQGLDWQISREGRFVGLCLR